MQIPLSPLYTSEFFFPLNAVFTKRERERQKEEERRKPLANREEEGRGQEQQVKILHPPLTQAGERREKENSL